nr:MAG TPA: hypothetical protein [Caudoviricetes sp.]DAT19813.1 MAG TPA: hypothetical protein [Caudoviricetes sp.]
MGLLLRLLCGLNLSLWGSPRVSLPKRKRFAPAFLPCSLNRPPDVFWRIFAFQKARYG